MGPQPKDLTTVTYSRPTASVLRVLERRRRSMRTRQSSCASSTSFAVPWIKNVLPFYPLFKIITRAIEASVVIYKEIVHLPQWLSDGAFCHGD